MTRREELFPEIRRLREDEGLIWREIGDRLGLAKTTVFAYYTDPTGEAERARKAQYQRPCEKCGKTLNPNGKSRGTKLCKACSGAVTREASRKWILDSFAEWNGLFGAPPSALDWNPALARTGPYCGWKAERYEATGRRWPCTSLVQENFGSWNAGLEAAGFATLAPTEYWIGHAGVTLREEDRAAA
jgi:hypothetical protein